MSPTFNTLARLGTGVQFPPRVGEDGRLPYSDGIENVYESIRLILLTEAGERVMLPDFGAGLKRFLFRSNTIATHRLIEEEILRSLARWEPRIGVERVDVDADDDDPHAALATIRFELVATRAVHEIQVGIALA